MALYLNSDFVIYHQFFRTTQAGIQKSINTLSALRSLPVPNLKNWEHLYSRLKDEVSARDDFNRKDWIKVLNDLTSESLRLDSRARAAVHDLVHVRLALTRGKMGSEAVREPSLVELEEYGQTLRDDLDNFVGESSLSRHRVELLVGGGSGLVVLEIVRSTKLRQPIRVSQSSNHTASQMQTARTILMERRSQWLYFNRNLRIYDGTRTYILKPLQRLHWTAHRLWMTPVR